MASDNHAQIVVDGPLRSTTAGIGDLELRDYLDLLRRRWWFVAGCTVLAVLATWWNMRNYVPIYTAEVLIERSTPEAEVGLRGFARVARQEELATDIAILRTRSVLGDVVDSLGLRLQVAYPTRRAAVFDRVEVAPEAGDRSYALERTDEGVRLLALGEMVAESSFRDPLEGPGLRLHLADAATFPDGEVGLSVVSRRAAIDRLRGGTTASSVGQTNLLRVSYADPDPILARDVANALAMMYQAQRARQAREDARRRRTFLEERMVSVTDSLQVAQGVLLDYLSREQSINPRAEGQGLAESLSTAEGELRRLRDQEATLENLLGSFRAGEREAVRQAMVLSQDLLPAAQSIYARIQEYETRRAELTASPISGRTENSPDVQLLDSLIAESRTEMRAIAEGTFEVVRRNRARAESRVADLRGQVSTVPERTTVVARLEQRVAAIQQMHDMLAERYYEAQIVEEVQSGDVRMVDPAVVPTGPSTGGRARALGLALLAGLLAGMVLVVPLERLDMTVRGTDDIEGLTALHVLGSIPERRDGEAVVSPTDDARGATSFLEAFRGLRANLRFVKSGHPRVLMVTSAEPGEGKSMVAQNLSLMLASDGKRVLLIDADLRRPTVHQRKGISRTPGLTDLIIGDGFDPSATTVDIGELYVIPAGTPVPNPTEMLGSERLRKTIDDARDTYDIIIFDTPPCLVVSDAAVIAECVDAALMVVRLGKSRKDRLTRAVRELGRMRVPLVGAVANYVPAPESSYSDYY